MNFVFCQLCKRNGNCKESASKMSGGGGGRGLVFSAPRDPALKLLGRCSKDNAASKERGKD